MDDTRSQPPFWQITDSDTALSIAKAMRPEFVEVRGCVLLAARYNPANFEQWWESLDGHRRKIEATLNHVHLWDMVSLSDDDQHEDVILTAIGQLMETSWRDSLRHAFPTRDFDVEFSDSEDDYGPTITFLTKDS